MSRQRSYPDPERVDALRLTTAPPAYAPQLTTRASGRLSPVHDHSAFLDFEGNGVTDVVASHFHRVKYGKVQVNDSDGHTHGLTGLPSGAG